jgi:CAAX protease family protein
VSIAPSTLDLALLVPMVGLMLVEVRMFAMLGQAVVRGTRRDPRPVYTYCIAYQWVVVAAIAGLWIATGRPWGALLLGFAPSWRLAAGLAVAAAYGILTIVQRHALLARPKLLARVSAQLGEAEALVPHTPQEMRLWPFVAITAGCCEEVMFRGFLLAVISSVSGLIAAVPITAVLFGLYHGYYGWRGILKTGAAGLIFALLAVGSTSLIPAVIVHATIDLASGELGYRAISAKS